MPLPKFYNTYLTAAVATIGGSLFGFDISSMSAIIGTEQYMKYFNSPDSTLQGGITASMAAGSLLGSLLSGPVCERIGRKPTIQYSCILWIIGSIITCASQNVAMLIVGRVINGLCVGFMSSQVPVYLAELAKREVRGKVIGIQQVSIEVGILVLYFIGYGCSFINSTASFRIPWGIQMIPAIVLFFLMPMFPESPRWLAGQGRWEECHEILANVHAKGDRDDSIVLAELLEIREIVDLEKSTSHGYLELFSKKNWQRSVVGIMTQVWQQLAGGNIMMYYVVYVFQMAGLEGNVNLIASSVQYVIMLVFTIPTLFYIDRSGRRYLMVGGSIGMGTFIFAVGALLARYGEHVDSVGGNESIHITLANNFGASRAVMVCSYLFIFVYALTWAPTAWIYAPEVFPLYLRSRGMSASAAGNWAMNFALGFYLPPAFDTIGWKAFMIFGTFNFAMAVHIFLTFPETAQKTLEEIDELFGPNAPPAWRTFPGNSRLADTAHELEVNPEKLAEISHVEEKAPEV
ncbi:high-affinity glucose transporter Hxt2p [Trichomonascus vanleenenianus]|uniref:sugar porter family MFS transporter n=1 Tax=Trichomonascus vanleenenianus TaxID=2268995 RepID=UPI003EC98B84